MNLPNQDSFQMRCPHCGAPDVRVPLVKGKYPRHFRCTHRESRDDKTKDYIHEDVADPSSHYPDHLILSKEILPVELLENAHHNRMRMISVIGSSRAGKTIWIRSLGLHALFPNPNGNVLYPSFVAHIQTLNSANEDNRMLSIQEMGAGKLSKRTEAQAMALAVPIGITLGDALKAPEPRYFKAFRRLFAKPLTDRLSLAIKDIGGEMATTEDPGKALTRLESQHLKHSDYHILMIEARSDTTITTSLNYANLFFELIKQTQSEESKKPSLIVVYSRVDERLQNEAITDLMRATMARPNRFSTSEHPDLRAYLSGMEAVEQAVFKDLNRLVPAFLPKMKSLFTSIHACAISSLGIPPVQKVGADRNHFEEAHCLFEPQLIRVFDPVVWILKREQMLNNLPNPHTP